jgi:hypothetical protein
MQLLKLACKVPIIQLYKVHIKPTIGVRQRQNVKQREETFAGKEHCLITTITAGTMDGTTIGATTGIVDGVITTMDGIAAETFVVSGNFLNISNNNSYTFLKPQS